MKLPWLSRRQHERLMRNERRLWAQRHQEDLAETVAQVDGILKRAAQVRVHRDSSPLGTLFRVGVTIDPQMVSVLCDTYEMDRSLDLIADRIGRDVARQLRAINFAQVPDAANAARRRAEQTARPLWEPCHDPQA